MTKTQNRRLAILSKASEETDSGLNMDELWQEYRMGKQYACLGEILDRMRAYKMGNEKEKYLGSVEAMNSEPAAGSSYWHTTVDRPSWFAGAHLF